MARRSPAPREESLSSKRDETDVSLRTERARTDGELSESPSKEERDADAVLAVSRERADAVVALARSRADEKLSASMTTADRDALAAERRSEDVLLATERAAEDRTLVIERAARRLSFASLLAAERASTDARLAEERVHADAASVRREDLLAVLAHDAESVLLATDITMEGLVQQLETDPRATREVIAAKRVSESIGLLRRLAAELVDFSGIAAGKLVVTRKAIDIADLVSRVVGVFQPLAASRGLSLTAPASHAPIIASADADRITQALGNFLNNAIKFTPAGGRISVSLRELADRVEVSVEDTGCGIPEDQQAVIFERFRKLNPGLRAGLGLGLYIARSVVEAHDGRVWVRSEPGRGSTFTFSLPRR